MPSSSEDVARAMRGQPKGFSRNYLRRNGTSFYMFWFRFIPEMFSALSAAILYGRAFVRFSACLAIHYFGVYSVFGSLITRKLKQTTTATATGTLLNKRFNEQNNSCARAL